MNNMLNILKSWLVIGLLGILSSAVSYGDCDLDALESKFELDGASTAVMDAFFESHKIEMVCCVKAMADHHRKHGISEEKKQKLVAAANKLGISEKEILDMVFSGRRVLDECDAYTYSERDIGRGGVVEDFICTEESKSIVAVREDPSLCNGLEQYNEAFDKFLEVFELMYQKCTEWIVLPNLWHYMDDDIKSQVRPAEVDLDYWIENR